MIQIPPEIQIKATIRTGSVYYFVEETQTSNEPHYFIVINNDPRNDNILLLVCSSSNIEGAKRRRKNILNTIVLIKKKEYAGFSMDSVIDCNMVYDRSIENIILRLRSGDLKMKPEFPIHLVEKLRKAALNSPLVKNEIKDLLRKSE